MVLKPLPIHIEAASATPSRSAILDTIGVGDVIETGFVAEEKPFFKFDVAIRKRNAIAPAIVIGGAIRVGP